MQLNEKVYRSNTDSICRYVPFSDKFGGEKQIYEPSDLPVWKIPATTIEAAARWWASKLFHTGFEIPGTPDQIALFMLAVRLDGLIDATDDHPEKMEIYIKTLANLLTEVELPAHEVKWHDDWFVGSLDVDYHPDYVLEYCASIAGLKVNMSTYPHKTAMLFFIDGGLRVSERNGDWTVLIESAATRAEARQVEYQKWSNQKYLEEQEAKNK